MIPNGEADQGTDSYMKLPILAPPSSRAGQIASVRPETPLTAIRSSQEATPAADLVVFDKQLRVLTARAKRHMATVRRNDADRDGGEFSILLGDVAQQRIILKGERPMTDVLNHRFARTWTPYGGDGEKRMLWTPRLGRAPWGGLGAPEGPQGVYSHSRGGSSRGPSGDGGGGGLDGGLMGSAMDAGGGGYRDGGGGGHHGGRMGGAMGGALNDGTGLGECYGCDDGSEGSSHASSREGSPHGARRAHDVPLEVMHAHGHDCNNFLFLRLRSTRKDEKGWQRIKQSFDPHTSEIWSQRALASDSKAVFNSREVEYKRFAADWAIVGASASVIKLVMRNDDDGGKDEDGDGIPDEVKEVGEVLWQHHRMLCTVFSFYAAVQQELYHLHLNAWTLFAKEFQLVSKNSKFCKQSDLDRLFIAVDAQSKRQEKEAENAAIKRGEHSHKKHSVEEKENALSRTEFLIALIHLAINKYVLTKAETDVSDALDRLIGIDITSQLTDAHAHPDSFRRAYLYSQPVAQVFQFHEASLRQIFSAIARCGGVKNSSAETMDLKEWMASLHAMEIVGADLTDREAVLCFVWSRMAVADATSLRGVIKDSSLKFEDWLEAIARLACLKALPTCQEIRDAGCTTTGQYMDMLHEQDETAYCELLKGKERKTEWGGVPTHQPFFHTLSHMIELMICRIEKKLGVTGGDMQISETEMARWMKSVKVV